MQEIVNLGHRAPNSHNSQMWNVAVDTLQKTIFIDLNEDRLLPKIDPQNREAWISCGAFAQNCIFAAQDFGYKSIINYQDDGIFISFDTIETATTKKYATLIKQRHTLRKPFLKKSIPFSVVENLKQISPNVKFIPNDILEFQCLIDLSQKANLQQMNDRDKMKELALWIRFSEKEALIKKDGLSLKELGMNRLERFIFRLFVNRKNFSENNPLLKQSLHKANALYSACGGYILITSTAQTREDWINSGLLLQEVWLKCVENDISVQPMSQVIEEEPYYTQLKEALKMNDEIQMVLRVGY